MKRYLLDSNIVIEFLKGNTEIRDICIELLPKGVMAFSPVTSAEIYMGIRKGEEDITRDLFEIMECFEINEDIGVKAGEYLKKYRKSHSIELGDALIAATAYYYNANLLTMNKKHFPMREIAFMPL